MKRTGCGCLQAFARTDGWRKTQRCSGCGDPAAKKLK
uniref:Uncharacterized protein n=1 Tax=Cucumis melo TaxID=3656 RepID=A0A9I9E437_CUCME